MQKLVCILCFSISLSILPMSWAQKESISEPSTMPTVHFTVVARVSVQTIDHPLRSSDVRRVEYGAPTPIIPYKVRLKLIKSCPPVPVNRFEFEGITRTLWMPNKDDEGIILLVPKDKSYGPSDEFPTPAFLPIEQNNGTKVVAFPYQNGRRIPMGNVWECLCDLVETRNRGPKTDINQKWATRLESKNPEEFLLALYFLLNVPGAHINWDILGSHLAATSSQGELFAQITAVIAQYATAENAAPALQALLTTVAAMPIQIEVPLFLNQCLSLVTRAPQDQQINLLNRVFNAEVQLKGKKQTLVENFASIKHALAMFNDEVSDQVLVNMLYHPANYAPLRIVSELYFLWEHMATWEATVTQSFLKQFLEVPTSEFVGLSLNDADREYLTKQGTALLEKLERRLSQ